MILYLLHGTLVCDCDIYLSAGVEHTGCLDLGPRTQKLGSYDHRRHYLARFPSRIHFQLPRPRFQNQSRFSWAENASCVHRILAPTAT